MDPSLLAALGGAGLSFAGGFAQQSAENRARRNSRRRGQLSIDQYQRPLDAMHFGQMEQFLRQAMGAQTGAYDDALSQLSLQSRGARRDAITRSGQGLSQGLQGLTGAGLGSSTLAQNYRTGAASGLARDLAGIDESLAGLRSNLLVGRGGAQAQGFASLADLFGRRQQRDADLEAQRFGLLTGTGLPQGGGGMPLDLSGIAQFASLFGRGGG